MAKNSFKEWSKRATADWSSYGSSLAHSKLSLPVPLFLLGALFFLLIGTYQSPQQLMSLAALKASQNNYSTSYLLYEKALIINPGSSVIHEKLGLLNLKVNNYKEALNEFNLSYAESPANTAGMRENNFASNEIATKLSLNNSIIKTTTILNIHPDFRNAWLQLAYLQYRLNNIKASKKALLRALNLDPNYSPSLQLQTTLR